MTTTAERISKLAINAAKAKPVRGTFLIATRDGEGPIYVDGWMLGEWAVSKGRYFWDVTHLPTGLKMCTYPALERRADALAHLERVVANPADVYADFILTELDRAPRL